MIIALFTLLPSLIIASKYSEFDGRIVNGVPISSDQYPWMVSLRYEMTSMYMNGTTVNKTWQYCGGSLIQLSPPIILTAGHCGLVSLTMLNDTNTITYQWFADINRTYDIIDAPDDTYYTLPVYKENIYVHPKFDMYCPGCQYKGYDLAIIMFNESLTESAQNKLEPYIPTLSTNTPCCDTNEDLTIMGYGLRSMDMSNNSISLRSTNMRYMDNVNCSQQVVDIILNDILINGTLPPPENLTEAGMEYGIDTANVTSIDELVEILNEYVETTDVYDDRVVCVIGNDTDACSGDSGGPLFRSSDDMDDIELIGVTSFVTGGGCNTGTFTAYTNIASYYDWIVNVTGMTMMSSTMVPKTTDIEDVIIYKWKEGLDNVPKIALIIATAIGWFCALICCICWCRTRAKVIKAQGSKAYFQFHEV